METRWKFFVIEALKSLRGNFATTVAAVVTVLVVMFICHHCPFVKHVKSELAALGRDYAAKDIGIVAVPGTEAQAVIDRLVAGGVTAILNYAPIAAQVPPHVEVRQIDPVLALQGMTYHLRRRARD